MSTGLRGRSTGLDGSFPYDALLTYRVLWRQKTGFVDYGEASWWANGICDSPLYQAQCPSFTLSPTASSPHCLNYRHISALPWRLNWRLHRLETKDSRDDLLEGAKVTQQAAGPKWNRIRLSPSPHPSERYHSIFTVAMVIINQFCLSIKAVTP